MYPSSGWQDAGPMIVCRHLFPLCFKSRDIRWEQKDPVILEWSKKKKKQVKGTYHHITLFLMPLFLCSHSSCLSPASHHFPLGSDKGVSIDSPISPCLPGLLRHVFLTSSFLPHVWPPSFRPSLFTLLPSLPVFLSPFPFLSAFICLYPSLHPHSSVSATMQSRTAAGLSTTGEKLTPSCV